VDLGLEVMVLAALAPVVLVPEDRAARVRVELAPVDPVAPVRMGLIRMGLVRMDLARADPALVIPAALDPAITIKRRRSLNRRHSSSSAQGPPAHYGAAFGHAAEADTAPDSARSAAAGRAEHAIAATRSRCMSLRRSAHLQPHHSRAGLSSSRRPTESSTRST
jgi:hypothetical protein